MKVAVLYQCEQLTYDVSSGFLDDLPDSEYNHCVHHSFGVSDITLSWHVVLRVVACSRPTTDGLV